MEDTATSQPGGLVAAPEDRIAALEAIVRDMTLSSQPAPAKQPAGTATAGGGEWSYFKTPVPLIYESPSGTTSWADSGSGRYFPSTARFALVRAAIEDTIDGAGRSVLWARGGGVEIILASLYETLAGTADSDSGQLEIPLSSGRFDWYINLDASGASQANVRIELVAWR